MTGDLPFPEDSVVLVLQAHLAKQPPAPSSRRPEIPAALDEIVLKCLEKDPAKRLPSCAEIRSALASVVLPPPERRRPPSPEPPPVGPGEAKRRTTAARAVDPVRVLVSHRSGSVRERLAHAVRDAIPSCRIWSATDNVEALRLARAHAPLLAVVDGEDTEMSGLELATERTYFRGHLFEVEGLVEERRAGRLARDGDAAGADAARQRALVAFEQAMAIQGEVIQRALGTEQPR